MPPASHDAGSVAGVDRRPPRPRAVRWASLALVAGCTLVVLVCVVAALRGRPWALAPGAVAAAIALREIRTLHRL
ncbi:hypothetical protein GCM10023113_07560 [Cellulomonas oligotrophica]|uniref:Uncharacterized protein n=1 Tax=Cellulomonas oligotrophica TaxID=931536 RepID=A0ABQ4D568_9CELL|nr:hypothetical protein Col01nite_00290 [Cellulomonas oligotrophica]